MQKLMMLVYACLGAAICATAAISAEDLAAAVKVDAAKAAKAMNDINAVPDKYVTLFPKGTEHGAIKDSEALPKICEDFDNFKATAMKLKDASAKAAGAAAQGRAPSPPRTT
jgi:cytochrome c556